MELHCENRLPTLRNRSDNGVHRKLPDRLKKRTLLCILPTHCSTAALPILNIYPSQEAQAALHPSYSLFHISSAHPNHLPDRHLRPLLFMTRHGDSSRA